MSRSMSLMRLTASPLGRPSTSVLAGRVRIPTSPMPQRPSFANKPFSTLPSKSAKATGQTSRFSRSGASSEAPAAVARENTQPAPGLEKTDFTESSTVSASSVPPPRPRVLPQTHSRPSPPPPKRVDTSSKEYKRAERRVTSVIVALPIFFVTSYYLYQRRDEILPPGLSGKSSPES